MWVFHPCYILTVAKLGNSRASNNRRIEVNVQFAFGLLFNLSVVLEDAAIIRAEGACCRLSNTEQKPILGTQLTCWLRMSRTRQHFFRCNSRCESVLSDLRFLSMSRASWRRWCRRVRRDMKVRLGKISIKGPKSCNHRGRGVWCRSVFRLGRRNAVKCRGVMGCNTKLAKLNSRGTRGRGSYVYKLWNVDPFAVGVVGVDGFNLNSLDLIQSRPPSLPHDMPLLCTCRCTQCQRTCCVDSLMVHG